MGEIFFNAARQAGGAIGVALLGTLLAGGALGPGLRTAMLVCAAAFAIAATVTAATVARRRPLSARARPGPEPRTRHHGCR